MFADDVEDLNCQIAITNTAHLRIGHRVTILFKRNQGDATAIPSIVRWREFEHAAIEVVVRVQRPYGDANLQLFDSVMSRRQKRYAIAVRIDQVPWCRDRWPHDRQVPIARW